MTIVGANLTGVAPLHVSVIADPVGGSGSYLAPAWYIAGVAAGFGTELNHTFLTTGTFAITVEVEDTTGDRASMNATAVVVPPTPDTPDSTLGWVPVAGALVGVGVFLGYLLGRRRGEWQDASFGLPPARPPPPEPIDREGDGRSATLGLGVPPDETTAVGPVRSLPPPAPDAIEGSHGVSSRAPARADDFVLSPVTVRTSERILLRLRETSGADVAGRAPRALTQVGLQEALNLPQGAIASALGRMVRAGLVTARLDHVAGDPRRKKVYRLTSRGEQLAQGLRAAPKRPGRP